MPVRARKNRLLERLRKAHKVLRVEDFKYVSGYKLARRHRAGDVGAALAIINRRKRRPVRSGAAQ
jgi:hypothetical protein